MSLVDGDMFGGADYASHVSQDSIEFQKKSSIRVQRVMRSLIETRSSANKQQITAALSASEISNRSRPLAFQITFMPERFLDRNQSKAKSKRVQSRDCQSSETGLQHWIISGNRFNLSRVVVANALLLLPEFTHTLEHFFAQSGDTWSSADGQGILVPA